MHSSKLRVWIQPATLIKVGVAIFIAVLAVLGIYRCPFKAIFGIACPGCGMTHAFFSALKLDFAAAFQYHPLFLIFGIETLYVIFYEPISTIVPVNKKVELFIAILSLLLLLIVWCIRQFII